MSTIPFDLIIKEALAYIAKAQHGTGAFASLSSFRPNDFTHAVRHATTFFTANILSCLNTIAEIPERRCAADPVRAKATAWLLEEMHPCGSFNYWAHDADERNSKPYPDDLDDTFNALAALAGYDRSLMQGKILGAAANILTRTEVQEGGPYRTWITALQEGPWADVDIAVNSTIGYFLSLFDVRLPHVEDLITASLAQDAPQSLYYPNCTAVLYFISRYCGGAKDGMEGVGRKVAAAILDFRARQGGALTPLEDAMTATSLMRCGARNALNPERLQALGVQAMQEQWQPYAFCMDPSRGGNPCYAGAGALTAAFVAEALSLYMKTSAPAGTPARMQRHEEGETLHVHGRIIASAVADADRGNAPLHLRRAVKEHVFKVHDHEITTLPHAFRNAIGTCGNAVPLAATDALALGNLYGWIAYDLYDDILDDAAGPFALPVANFFLRKLASLYSVLGEDHPDCRTLFLDIMNAVDGAHLWEQRHCRFPSGPGARMPERVPDFKDCRTLADRSIGHAMGPLAVLLMAGYAKDSPAFAATLDLFRHYLIARQLHDDAHDWADDLLHGRIASAGAMAMQGFRERHPDKARNDLLDTLPRLREYFWEETIDEVVALIRGHLAAAREARARTPAIADKDFMENRLCALEAGAARALAERDNVRQFAAHYQSGRPL